MEAGQIAERIELLLIQTGLFSQLVDDLQVALHFLPLDLLFERTLAEYVDLRFL
jgi:hypothetical protein